MYVICVVPEISGKLTSLEKLKIICHIHFKVILSEALKIAKYPEHMYNMDPYVSGTILIDS